MLEQVDLTRKIAKPVYRAWMPQLRNQLYSLQKAAWDAGVPVILLFEGWDAAGKGTTIQALTRRLDPRGFKLYPIRAARTYEKKRPWLWRFWNKIPAYGEWAIFDRSWYGRVLVERIEGFCSREAWQRAYREINAFERQLVEYGTVLFKFWMHISKDEQLRRFEARAADPIKQWKLTEDDWRNREKWDLYYEAVDEMLLKTSTHLAPWTVVEGNDKYYARVKVVRTLVEGLSAALEYDPFRRKRRT